MVVEGRNYRKEDKGGVGRVVGSFRNGVGE